MATKAIAERQVSRNWRNLVYILAVLTFTVPVFRSGGRTELTAAEWLLNHTVFGPPVEYVPIENYIEEIWGKER